MKHFENDNEFDAFLRERLKGASLSPPNSERAWEHIQHTLQQESTNKWKWLVLACILPFIVLTSWYYIATVHIDTPRVAGSYLPYSNQYAEVVETREPSPKLSVTIGDEGKKQAHGPLNSDRIKNSSAHTIKAPLPSLTQHKEIVQEQLAGFKLKEAPKEREGNSTFIPTFSGGKVEHIGIPLLANMNHMPIVAPTLEMEGKKVSRGPLRNFKNAYIGLHRNITTNWILNQNTYKIFGTDHLGLAVFWGGSWGHHIGWDVRKNLSIELGVNWLATHGQKQRDLSYGRKASFEVDMLYHQFPLILKRRHHPILFGKRITAYAEGGIQYARLLLARQEINRIDKGGIYTRFNKDEISLLVGYSLDIPISQRVFLNTAIRGRISNNINAQNWKVDGNYGNSHNLAVGLTIGLNYRLSPLKRN